MTSAVAHLRALHAVMEECVRCPSMIGPVVHGPAITSPVLLIGQAPGPREGEFGRPFAWTAGRTLFRWFESATGADEARIRDAVYFAAVARCFPGKAKGGGDRRPDPQEITNCRGYLADETAILQPALVIPVGTLAIAEVTGHTGKLVDVVGQVRRIRYFDVECDAIALPHPSGASTWHRREPGLSLLAEALALIGRHPAMLRALA